MTILVTGASGFIGKNLLEALVNKFGANNIVALTSQNSDLCKCILHNNYTFDNNYLLKSGCEDIDTIIHAGAYTPKNSQMANDFEKCISNIINTQKILSSNLPNLSKFVFLSTLDVYGENNLITEESSINPISLYGSSKFFCEKLIENWAKENSKICQILRIGHVYGNGEENYQKLIPVTINKILKFQKVEQWGDGKDLRTFIHVSDVVSAILSSVNLNEYKLPINIVGSQPISIIDLINKIIKLSDKDCKIEKIDSNGITRNLVFDNSKMSKYLISPKKDFDIGLLEEIKYMENLL